MDTTAGPHHRFSWRELVLALILALGLGVAAVGRPVWDGDWIYFATDTASVQAPWHATEAAQNNQLSDSGVAFYPHYRLVARRWLAGELPLWNPDIYVGVPLLANPQWGVLDPQVGLLVLAEAWGGREGFDRAFAWLAVLRIAGAALGTYLLARCMGLRWGSSALAATGYALSGSVVLWLGHSLSHVTPWLPWVLLGIEGLRSGRRPRLSWGTTSLAMALAIYGGHPEVAFFVGFSAGLWSLSLWGAAPRAALLALLALSVGVLLAAPVLVPFVEYLSNSGALLAHRLAPSPRRFPDLLCLGACLLFLGVLVRWRGRHFVELPKLGAVLHGGVMGLILAALALVLHWRGAQFDLGWIELQSIEHGSTRMAGVIVSLALVAMIGFPLNDRGQKRLALFGAGSLLLAAAAPGIVDLWRWIPLVGLAAPARAACCASLFLALLAGFALQNRTRVASMAVGFALLLLMVAHVANVSMHRELPSTRILDVSDPVVQFAELPVAGTHDGLARLSGVTLGGLRADRAVLHFERINAQGELLEIGSFRAFAEFSEPDDDGRQPFDFGQLYLAGLGPGHWRLHLTLERDGEPLGERTPCLLILPKHGDFDAWGLAFSGAAVLCLLFMGTRRSAWALALSVGQGLLLVHSWNPAVEKQHHLFESKTEQFLALHYPGERFVAAPGILPADTALLSGLATIDGYDALDVDSFDGYRAFAMKPEHNPLLYWNADGLELSGPAFRLFGVGLLLSHSARQLPGWQLVAGPQHPEHVTEVFVYRADLRLPRAYCVPSIRSLEEVVADPGSFDPEREAFLSAELSVVLERPFKNSHVTERLRSPEHLEYDVELDGDGLFLCTEQFFPGWKLWVDGEPQPIRRVNSIFRGAFLGPGVHELRFEYQPQSWRWGLGLGAAGVLLLLVGLTLSARLVGQSD